MNLKDRLLHISKLLSETRRVGQTTLMAKVAKDIGGVVLAYSFRDAQRIEREHGVPAKSVEINLKGITGPFVIDHFAVATLLTRAANKIHDMDIFNKRLVEQNKSMQKFFDEIVYSAGDPERLKKIAEAIALAAKVKKMVERSEPCLTNSEKE